MSRRFAAPLTAVDRVGTCTATRVEAVKEIVADDPYLAGHYPDFTIYPGVFTLESVHQAVRLWAREHRGGHATADLVRIDSLSFAAPLLPGDTLHIGCDVAGDADDPHLVRVRARCTRGDGTLAARATLGLRIREEGDPAPAPGAVPAAGTAPAPAPGAAPVVDHAPVLDHATVRRVLPHRHPVLLVDEVAELVPGEHVVATKAVAGSEPCYADLAEDLPGSAYAYPASLLVESFGQSGAVLWLRTAEAAGTPVRGTLVFGSARDVSITGSARPGQVLRHVVRIDRTIGDNVLMEGEIWAGGERIATVGSVLAAVRGGLSAAAP
ncbi:3-hydroxyacyl-ACP dehydratase FabZ family protein [Streptomyces sp. NPDC059637]|uniref:3-hydroxyacyl-ACP dehydratase FabZ family protein n=1 Tax=Streptomyces sp. NPDC059637 TaxID=3347752 RepID=UPI00368F1800